MVVSSVDQIVTCYITPCVLTLYLTTIVVVPVVYPAWHAPHSSLPTSRTPAPSPPGQNTSRPSPSLPRTPPSLLTPSTDEFGHTRTTACPRRGQRLAPADLAVPFAATSVASANGLPRPPPWVLYGLLSPACGAETQGAKSPM
ncbi:hypothetical protein B0H17DRAFT_1219136 [Mycena rosella]|uniref:Uncharacterized protein n=1 Tax=Mycena rosella TaxID=1033263 RepID=A0AAD7FJP7_MYCRO|nr:hypothetical protein B0H17DRAFT_1219136 [Mycena rosella]